MLVCDPIDNREDVHSLIVALMFCCEQLLNTESKNISQVWVGTSINNYELLILMGCKFISWSGDDRHDDSHWLFPKKFLFRGMRNTIVIIEIKPFGPFLFFLEMWQIFILPFLICATIKKFFFAERQTDRLTKTEAQTSWLK